MSYKIKKTAAISREMEAEIIRTYLSTGMSCPDLGKAFNVSWHNINYILAHRRNLADMVDGLNIKSRKGFQMQEWEYEETILSKSEKMHIELTSPFYQNLCKGFDIPSLGINVTPESK